MSEWYISVTGNNGNNGNSTDSPWRTIIYACANINVQPGDTIWIQEGQYNEGQINLLISGSELSPITTISAWNSESVIVTGGFDNQHPNDGEYKPYYYNYFFRNFEIVNGQNGFKFVKSTGQPTFTSAAQWIFENINSHNHLSNGVYFGYQNNKFGYAKFTNCQIHHNGSNGEGEGDSGIIFEASGTFEFWNCDVYENGYPDNFWNDKGINCFNQPGYYYCIISGCRIYDNYETGMDFPGAYSTISHNMFYGNGLRDAETAEGQTGDNHLSLQPGMSSGGNNIISYNLFRDSGFEEIWVSQPGNIIHNNTFYLSSGNDVTGSLQTYRGCLEMNKAGTYGPATGNIIRNNIFINLLPAGHPTGLNMYLPLICHNTDTYDTYGGNTWSNNIYYSPNQPDDLQIVMKNWDEGGGINRTCTVAQLQSIYSQDLNSSYSNVSFIEIPSCSINTGSIAYNFGTTNISDNITITNYSGSAPDCGWWEAIVSNVSSSISIIFGLYSYLNLTKSLNQNRNITINQKNSIILNKSLNLYKIIDNIHVEILINKIKTSFYNIILNLYSNINLNKTKIQNRINIINLKNKFSFNRSLTLRKVINNIKTSMKVYYTTYLWTQNIKWIFSSPKRIQAFKNRIIRIIKDR